MVTEVLVVFIASFQLVFLHRLLICNSKLRHTTIFHHQCDELVSSKCLDVLALPGSHVTNRGRAVRSEGGRRSSPLTCLNLSLCPAGSESSLQTVLHQSIFLSAMSPQPSRDLTLCWEQHRKLLPGVAGVHANTVQHWSVQQVSATGQAYRQILQLSLSLSGCYGDSISDMQVSKQCIVHCNTTVCL